MVTTTQSVLIFFYDFKLEKYTTRATLPASPAHARLLGIDTGNWHW